MTGCLSHLKRSSAAAQRVPPLLLAAFTDAKLLQQHQSCSTMAPPPQSQRSVGVAPMIKNRNPMNLEKMRIGFKPSGFPSERRNRNYWNSLDLSMSNNHATATVTHWTGRRVCSASTQEWAIRKFLYNFNDSAALKCVGTIIGLRCLETGITEVCLQLAPEDLNKDRMGNFVKAIKETGLILEEPPQYKPFDPHADLDDDKKVVPIKPWEVLED